MRKRDSVSEPQPERYCTESDEELLVPKRKTHHAKPANKKHKASEDPIHVDSESEDRKDKKGRLKTNDNSQILNDFRLEITSIRPLSQQMMLARDGIEANPTSPARPLNLQTILQAAEQKLEAKLFKQLKNALLTSYDNENDQ